MQWLAVDEGDLANVVCLLLAPSLVNQANLFDSYDMDP
jgi:hypothetical protein